MTPVLMAAAATLLFQPALAGDALPYFDGADFTPKWHTADVVPPDFHSVPPFTLDSHLGRTVSAADMDDHITVVDFFFATCHGICPSLSRSMKTIDNTLADVPGLLLLSHSVTPERDTVPVLREHAGRIGAQSGRWHLLTGDREVIYRLAREVYFVDEDPGKPLGDDDFLHTEMMVLLDGERRIRGVYNGVHAGSVQQLIEDIGTLHEERRAAGSAVVEGPAPGG